MQLRIKDCSKEKVATEIETAILLSRYYTARIFINNYWQLGLFIMAPSDFIFLGERYE